MNKKPTKEDFDAACERLLVKGHIEAVGVDDEGNTIWSLTEEGKRWAQCIANMPSSWRRYQA